MFSDEKLKEMARSMDNYAANTRRHLIISYTEDNLPDIGAAFYGELLRNENDDICKWYEIGSSSILIS